MIIEKQNINNEEVITLHADEDKVLVRINNGVHICKSYTLKANDNVSDFIEVNDGNDYKVRRANAYPPIAEQLDMLYHDKVEGTNVWFETIQAVKNNIPKED